MTKEEKKALQEAERIKKEQETAAIVDTPVTSEADVVEIEDKLDPLTVTEQRKELPTLEAKAEPLTQPGLSGERPVTPKPVMEPKPVQTVQPAIQETPEEDPMRAAILEANKQQNKSFLDYVQGIKDDYERERAEGQARVDEAKRAARWAGATELASSIANLIAVGNHNAVSQQYKNFSQDWMRKADQEAREHRNRINDLRARQRDTELKMQQIRSEGLLNLAKYDLESEERKQRSALTKAQTEYQKARTDAAREKAKQDAAEAKEKLEYIKAQTRSQAALEAQRRAAAYSSVTKANAAASNAASQIESRELNDQTKVDEASSRIMKNLGQTGYLWDPINGKYGPAGAASTPPADKPSLNDIFKTS